MCVCLSASPSVRPSVRPSVSVFLSAGLGTGVAPCPRAVGAPERCGGQLGKITACTTEASIFKMNDSVTSNKGRRTQHAIRKPASSHTWPRVGVLLMAEVGPPKATAKKLGKTLENLLKTKKPEERPGSRPPSIAMRKGQMAS